MVELSSRYCAYLKTRLSPNLAEWIMQKVRRNEGGVVIRNRNGINYNISSFQFLINNKSTKYIFQSKNYLSSGQSQLCSSVWSCTAYTTRVGGPPGSSRSSTSSPTSSSTTEEIFVTKGTSVPVLLICDTVVNNFIQMNKT